MEIELPGDRVSVYGSPQEDTAHRTGISAQDDFIVRNISPSCLRHYVFWGLSVTKPKPTLAEI